MITPSPRLVTLMTCAALTAALVACKPQTADAPAAEAKDVAVAAPAPASKYKEVEYPGAAVLQEATFRTNVIEVPLAAKGDPDGNDQVEYMLRMSEGQRVGYSWTAQAATDFWHEFHGHTEDTVTFYKKADGVQHQGALTAPFTGIHGWYFENRSPNPVVVRLQLGGFYDLDRKED